MSTFLIAVGAFLAFIVAYHTYGRWLARKIFALDADAVVPSKQLCDDVDFVPSRKSIVFGHHFTSIAGTGPIVGPAIAVFWGWLPALLWVIFGSIFIGAVHDFGALVVSLRNRGQTVGEVAGRIISPRAKVLFLLVLFFALTIVLAIFGLVIASIFKVYPESVLPVWISLPIAIVIGLVVRKRPGLLFPLSLLALVLIYLAVYIGAYHFPIELNLSFLEGSAWAKFLNPIVVWTFILLIYCAVASVLPVWLLLQPRDFINSYQLFAALALLLVGLCVASMSGAADLFTAPAIVATDKLPMGTPPIWPFLFITIACGAISGFHCLVSSGTSSKQISCETDAQYIGYGAMLMEGALATVVILACCAGTGMGKIERVNVADSPVASISWQTDAAGDRIVGEAAWQSYYQAKTWGEFGLPRKLSAFVDGGANFLTAIGIPLKMAVGIIAVLVACFAATTLDTATRLQRYVIQELGAAVKVPPAKNMYVATLIAVVMGGAIAVVPGPQGVAGTGGLLLWPMFGATNQLLAGLAFMVTVFYLWRRNQPVWFVLLPMLLMIVMPAWAMLWQLFSTEVVNGQRVGWMWNFKEHLLLGSIGLMTLGLQAWMVLEAILMWPKAKGVIEEALPPLDDTPSKLQTSGGRSC